MGRAFEQHAGGAKFMNLSNKGVFVGLFLGATALGSPAFAQIAPGLTAPPVFQQVDDNGVELQTGRFVKILASISIGPGGPGSLGFDWSTDPSKQQAVWGYVTLLQKSSTTDMASVTVGGSTETFSSPHGGYSFTQDQGRASTLTYNSTTQTYTYTGSDGSVAAFNGATATGTDGFGNTIYTTRINSLTYPAGQQLNYFYGTDSGSTNVHAVTSSLGYQLRLTWSGSSVTSAVVFNMNSETCDPTAASCTLVGNWPKLTWDSANSRIVDSTGDWVGWTLVNGLTTITYPSGRKLTYSGSVTSGGGTFSDGKGTWTYQYPNAQYGATVSLIFNPENNAPRAVQWSNTTGLFTSDTIYDGITDTSLTTSYGYDSDNRLTSITHPDGTKTTYGYDPRGNLQSVHQVSSTPGTPADIVTSAIFPSSCSASTAKTCNQPTSVTDANGHTTTYTYNSNSGGVATVTYPTVGSGTPKITYTYTAENAKYKNGSGTIITGPTVYELTKTAECISGSTCTTANELDTTVSYDPNQALMPTSVTEKAADGSLSATTAYTYTGNGDANTVDGPLAGSADTTRNYYDAMRRPLGSIGPSPGNGQPMRAMQTIYDQDGRPATEEIGTATGQGDTDLANMTVLQKQVTAYDLQGRISSVSSLAGSTTYGVVQRSYSKAGALQCSRVLMNSSEFTALPADPCTVNTTGTPDRITYTAHDGYFRTASVTTGYGTSSATIDATNTYDSAGRLASMQDANGNITAYSYDGMGRLSSTCYADSSSDCESFTYDGNGNLYSQTMRSGDVLNYRYDALNRLTLKSSSSLADRSYTYDNLGHMLSATYNGSGLGVTNTYYPLGWLQTSSSDLSGTAQTMSYGYDLAGRRNSVTYPTVTGTPDLSVTYNYLNTGEVSSIVDGTTTLASYTYDALGDRASVTYGNGVSQNYSHDPMSRLTTLAMSGSSNNLTIGGSSTPITYDAASELISAPRSNSAYSFTGAVAATRTYPVNSLNQVTETDSSISPTKTTFTYDANGNLTGDGTWAYTYDAENHLTKAVDADKSANLSYDPLGRLYKVAGSGIGDVSFVDDGDEIAAEYSVSSGALLRRHVFGPAVDEPIVEYSATGARTWLVSDERGSIIARTDASGNAGTINSYDEYGIPASTNAGRYQYTGQAYLYEIGLDYYKNRMYSPTLGRFLQTDPIGYDDGLNWYAYVHNDPVNGADAFGTQDDSNSNPDNSEGQDAPNCDLNPDQCINVYGQRDYEFTNCETSICWIVTPDPIVDSGSGPGAETGLFHQASLNFLEKAVVKGVYAHNPQIRQNIKKIVERITGKKFTDAQIDKVMKDIMNGRSTSLSGLKAFESVDSANLTPTQVAITDSYIHELPSDPLNDEIKSDWDKYKAGRGR